MSLDLKSYTGNASKSTRNGGWGKAGWDGEWRTFPLHFSSQLSSVNSGIYWLCLCLWSFLFSLSIPFLLEGSVLCACITAWIVVWFFFSQMECATL